MADHTTDVLPDPNQPRKRRGLRRHAATASSEVAPATESDGSQAAPDVASLIPAPRVGGPGPAPEGLAAVIDRAELLRELASVLAGSSPAMLVQFGLDNFRHLNAGVGPDAGDAALRRTGVALSWAFAPHQIARLGGDCFAVVLPYDGRPDAETKVNNALTLIADIDLSNNDSGVRATASAGITILDRPGLTPAGVLLEADLAMATAKSEGRNRLAVHNALESSTVSAVHDWAAKIRLALEQDTFVLHAQPVRSLRGLDDQWELLVRLPASDGALLPPAEFLPVAERFGLMTQVDCWVTSRAVAMIAAQAAGGHKVRLEVNIGQSTLASPDFVEMVEESIATSGIDPGCLIFEVNGATASTNLDDVKVFSQRLRELGCMFAIDGFGRNSGALEQLKVLPLDFVKIDGSFVRHLPRSVADQHIVHALTTLAHDLGCQVIAMAVGDDESRELLDGFGVDFVQGFHIGRPQPLAETL